MLAALVACGDTTFLCEGGQCGANGQCEVDGWCSFADDECESGRRYGELSGDGLAGVCVPAAPSLTGDGESSGAPPVPTAAGPTGASTEGDTGGGYDTLALTSGVEGTRGDATSTSGASASHTDDGSTSGEATTSSTPPLERVTDGLLVLHRFDEGDGLTVFDQSGTDPAIDLTIEPEGASPAWVADGLEFSGAGIARALGSSTKIRTACVASGEVTVEAWLSPSNLLQEGPARIVTLSESISVRSFTLGLGPVAGQEPAASWAVRLDTTTNAGVNGTPTMYAPATRGASHVAFTRSIDGTLNIWVDAALASTGVRDGDLTSWPENHTFAVGNEIDLLRPFLGVVHLVAVYDRALADDEVAQNFAAGF